MDRLASLVGAETASTADIEYIHMYIYIYIYIYIIYIDIYTYTQYWI